MNNRTKCITVKNLTKYYSKPLCESIRGLFSSDKDNRAALNNISFGAYKGESIGIIGKNGSGKSTLLKILSGVTSQTSGTFLINGRISSLLELGCGFNPEYTGISNIYLNGTLFGLTKKETKNLVPKICEFADIGEYINKPIKTYSDGMFLRLAFACAVTVKPDILIIDEALAVGDFAFRQKCFNKISELKQNGVTVLLVSHDIDTIRRFCDRCIWLSDGNLIMDGDTESVTAEYMESVTGSAENILPNQASIITCTNRFGSAVGAIEAITVPPIIKTGESYRTAITLTIPKNIDLETAAVSVSAKNQFGLDLTVDSTADEQIKLCSGKQTITIESICLLCRGEYSLSVSLENRGTTPITYYDYIENAARFKVISHDEYFGVFHNKSTFIISDGDIIE